MNWKPIRSMLALVFGAVGAGMIIIGPPLTAIALLTLAPDLEGWKQVYTYAGSILLYSILSAVTGGLLVFIGMHVGPSS